MNRWRVLLIIVFTSLIPTLQPIEAYQIQQTQSLSLVGGRLVDTSTGVLLAPMPIPHAPSQEIGAIEGWQPLSSPEELIHSQVQPNRIIPPTDDRIRVTPTTQAPWSKVVKINFNMAGTPIQCSGWMLGASAVATAGHCIYARNPLTQNYEVGTNYRITPALDGVVEPFGQCKAHGYILPQPWLSIDYNYDWGILLLQCKIGYTSGVLGFRSTIGDMNGILNAITGYPGVTPANSDNGISMWTGNGTIVTSDPRIFKVDTDMTSGQSGGAVWQTTDIPSGCSNPCVLGINSAEFDPPELNHAIRITPDVFDVLFQWRQYVWHGVFLPMAIKN